MRRAGRGQARRGQLLLGRLCPPGPARALHACTHQLVALCPMAES